MKTSLESNAPAASDPAAPEIPAHQLYSTALLGFFSAFELRDSAAASTPQSDTSSPL